MTDNEIIAELKKEPAAELRRLQKMPYEWKVSHALDVIHEFVEHEGENGVYVSFSGGKDSLVLLHLVRSIYPNVPAVFANTGIEFPEQVKFARSFENVTEVYPIKHFPKILKEDGIVFPSKEVAMYVKDAKNGCNYAINGFNGLDLNGKENRYKARFKRWAYLLCKNFARLLQADERRPDARLRKAKWQKSVYWYTRGRIVPSLRGLDEKRVQYY